MDLVDKKSTIVEMEGEGGDRRHSIILVTVAESH